MKGLFCTVPAGAMERVCVFGFRRSDEDLAPQIFGGGALDDDDDGAAQQAATASDEPAFPRSFSRYSTLDELADAAKSNENDPIRFLALCRVAVGDVSVGPVPETAAKRKGDSYYDPHTEEYLPLDPGNVLPEFLIAYRFVPRTSVVDRPIPLPNGPAWRTPSARSASRPSSARLALAESSPRFLSFPILRTCMIPPLRSIPDSFPFNLSTTLLLRWRLVETGTIPMTMTTSLTGSTSSSAFPRRSMLFFDPLSASLPTPFPRTPPSSPSTGLSIDRPPPVRSVVLGNVSGIPPRSS